jgi:hypothetical protein
MIVRIVSFPVMLLVVWMVVLLLISRKGRGRMRIVICWEAVSEEGTPRG